MNLLGFFNKNTIDSAMNAEILSIGDEILIGQTVNTNAAFIGRKLTEIGIDVRWVSAVGDTRDDILNAISAADSRADVIITTGGLGPTHDDITKNVFCEYFGSNLVLDKALQEKVRQRFEKRGMEMPAVNIGQAMVPDNAEILKNPFGTAPGLRFEKNGKYFFVIPGVPFEMKNLVLSEIIPFLSGMTNNFIRYRTIRTTDIGESSLFEKIDIVDKLQETASIAFLPKYSGVDIRITAHGSSERDCLQKIKKVEESMILRIQDYIWGYDDQLIENALVERLIETGKRIALLEVFTGGLIAEKLSNDPGFKSIIAEAMITSGLEKLASQLQIPRKTFEEHGEISAELTTEIAKSIRHRSNADYALATSAFKEISDEDSREQNGFLYIGFASKTETSFREIRLSKDYIFNKNRAAHLAMDFLRRQI
ncbi:CinA family nicotinamide mononucleotide deamidase-related protein [candidate division KSB1 bacterium]|nr:CinA family nicotinamide mononucleotide deamidase-related protein [candidate division KSB1 bacterium]